jgi:hypothetical protein
MLGMYVHMHWGYRHPYAARTWSIEDWFAFLKGLKSLGYDLVQIWPVIDTMPAIPTESDRAHLEKLRQVIDAAHLLGMTAYVGASANTLGNERAGAYRFEDRPYFAAERLIDPSDDVQVRRLIQRREDLLGPLRNADGFWIIDSDPGGYVGSAAADFVKLFLRHREMLDSLRPGIRLLYWMWTGWTDDMQFGPEWSDHPQDCWRDALDGIQTAVSEPWGIIGCWKGHFGVVDELGLTDRTMYLPYGTVELEPSFPWTNYDPKRIANALMKVPVEERPLGVTGNSQTHCVQLPHLYLFSHFAHGGTSDDIGLAGFADEVLPGHGDVLANAWMSFAGEDVAQMKAALAKLREIPEGSYSRNGKHSGLCFNDTRRLIDDLTMQTEVKIAILELRERLKADEDLEDGLDRLARTLGTWYERHRFSDRYYGPFREFLHPVLNDVVSRAENAERLKAALEDFGTGRPHGVGRRLLDAVTDVAKQT